jgi:PBP1b-binding outer membrane lipoprotein LpoB
MKKVFLALAIMMAITVASCKQVEATDTTTVDTVQVDTVSVDTTKVDTTKVDTVKVK